ncbi:nicotinamide mononucleotide transporter, partial [bacterium]|nr:nicotinamide mononucleotide transporter [bacterium]
NVYEVHWDWPLSIVASLLYAWLFFESKLYGETGVNLFFAVSSVWGWWQWVRGSRASTGEALQIAQILEKKCGTLSR